MRASTIPAWHGKMPASWTKAPAVVILRPRTLREIARTVPYMHDGSITTLEDVVDFYDRGGRPNANLDPEIRQLRLPGSEKLALAAFLRTLSGVMSDNSVR